MFNIENCPAEAWNYEFIVCKTLNNKLIFDGYYKNGHTADAIASRLNHGVVIHNVRIHGYRKP